MHWGGSALLLVLITSCFSSSTMILPSRSCGRKEDREGRKEGPCREKPAAKSKPAPERREDRSETASGFPHGDGSQMASKCFITAWRLCPTATATLRGRGTSPRDPPSPGWGRPPPGEPLPQDLRFPSEDLEGEGGS